MWTIADGRPRHVAFVNDLAGQALARDEADRLAATGDPHQRWYRFDGREMGSISNDGTDETSYARLDRPPPGRRRARPPPGRSATAEARQRGQRRL